MQILYLGNRKQKKVLKTGNKPWFTKVCDVKRDAFHEIKIKYNNDKRIENKNLLSAKSKKYKRELNKSFRLYQEKCSEELRSHSKHDTKAFWRTIKKYSGSTKRNPPIPIDTFYEYFKSLNDADDADDDNDVDLHQICENPLYDVMLNSEIAETEILDAIKNLKNSKSPGLDKILNEYLKNSPPALIKVLYRIFNLILDTGIIPDDWTIGIIKPMYKNKGDTMDPDNFRAITLISCLGKLFTSILNIRMTFFANEISLLSYNQAGFRKGHSTIDNIFVLNALISLYQSFGKKLYCAFIDFRKAFDTVWRTGLWKKLINSGIKGKIFSVIYNMYNNIKSCVQYNSEQSDFFPCLTGVRQGENLSPFLFSIFLNDLETFLIEHNCSPLTLVQDIYEQELNNLLEIFVILYADDTVLLADTRTGMQNALDLFQLYCNQWKLEVNVNKTKIIIFCKRKSTENFEFRLQNTLIEIVDSFSYLGLMFKYNGNFRDARKKLANQAQKSLFSIYKNIRNQNIPIDIQLKLFDAMVEPILLYGSEIWGYENGKIIEQVHLSFCKRPSL